MNFCYILKTNYILIYYRSTYIDTKNGSQCDFKTHFTNFLSAWFFLIVDHLSAAKLLCRGLSNLSMGQADELAQ